LISFGEIQYYLDAQDINFPRSYVPEIVVQADFLTEPFLDGSVIQFDTTLGYTYRLKISEEFYAWSSNVYSTSYVFSSEGSSIDCHFVDCYDFCLVTFGRVINDRVRAIVVKPNGAGTDFRIVPLPPAPPGYWNGNTGWSLP